MKKKSKLFLILIVLAMQIFVCSACAINFRGFIARNYPESGWYCEELGICCLKESAFAVMEYEGQAYTNAYYEELSYKISNAREEDLGKVYPSLSGFVDYDGKFYLCYREDVVVYGEELGDYYFTSLSSQNLLIGEVKKHGDYISVIVEVDNLYDGTYVGKTITLEQR